VIPALLAGFVAGSIIGAVVGVVIVRLIAVRSDAETGRASDPSIAELNGRIRAWTTRLRDLTDDLIWGPIPLAHADEAIRPAASTAPAPRSLRSGTPERPD
jgi:hypothetical protein